MSVLKLLLDLRANGFVAQRVEVGAGENPSVVLDGITDLRAEQPKRRPGAPKEPRAGVDGLLREYGGQTYEEMLAAAAGQEPRDPGAPGDIALVREED